VFRLYKSCWIKGISGDASQNLGSNGHCVFSHAPLPPAPPS